MANFNATMVTSPWRDGKCEGRNEQCEFLARESVNSSPIVRIFGKGKCKFIANFSATMVTSLPSLSLSLSLSLCISLSLYLSLTEYIVREVQSVREREREWDGSSETEVVRRKWRHHCRAKIGDKFDKFALPLPKIRTYRFPLHTSRLSLHGEVTRDGSDVTIVTLKLAINLHFPLPKIRTYRFPFTLLVSPFTERSPLWTSKNSIKLIPKTIGNRKRDCAWGCAGVKKLKKNQLLSTNHHQVKQIWVLMICAQQLIFLPFFDTRASSRTISFSISNSFWY